MSNEKRVRNLQTRLFVTGKTSNRKAIPVAAKQIKKHGRDRTEGFQRAIADFVCFHCPLVAPARAKSLRSDKNQLWKCALRRGQGGERKAPLSLPQERNPCTTGKQCLKVPSRRNAAHCLPKHMREQRHRAQDREHIRNRFGKENRKHRVRNEQRQQIHQRNQQNQLAQARQK